MRLNVGWRLNASSSKLLDSQWDCGSVDERSCATRAETADPSSEEFRRNPSLTHSSS